VTLKYEDITDWRLPIESTDIAQEIVRAQEDRDYVVKMRVHEGVKRLLKSLHSVHRIVIMTARKGSAGAEWAVEWLRRNGLPYDEVVQGPEARKSEHRADVLIDDYIGNIDEYLSNTDGVAVLVDQPWNRDRDTLAPVIGDGRLFVVKDLFELVMQLPDIIQQARKRSSVRAPESFR
jgi:5'(3')-deoxyribonucleotidase